MSQKFKVDKPAKCRSNNVLQWSQFFLLIRLHFILTNTDKCSMIVKLAVVIHSYIKQKKDIALTFQIGIIDGNQTFPFSSE